MPVRVILVASLMLLAFIAVGCGDSRPDAVKLEDKLTSDMELSVGPGDVRCTPQADLGDEYDCMIHDEVDGSVTVVRLYFVGGGYRLLEPPRQLKPPSR